MLPTRAASASSPQAAHSGIPTTPVPTSRAEGEQERVARQEEADEQAGLREDDRGGNPWSPVPQRREVLRVEPAGADGRKAGGGAGRMADEAGRHGGHTAQPTGRSLRWSRERVERRRGQHPGQERRGRPVGGSVAGRPARTTRSCCATATGATSSTATGTGASRRSSPTSTRAGTVPRGHRELGARLQHRFGGPDRERVQRRRGPHRRPAALEPARRDGHRPLPARAPPPRRRRRWRRWAAEPRRLPLVGRRQPARRRCRWRRTDLPRRLRPAVRPGGPGPVARRRARRATPVLAIAQFGSTRSINAGAAAGDRHARVDPHARAAQLPRALTPAWRPPGGPLRRRESS